MTTVLRARLSDLRAGQLTCASPYCRAVATLLRNDRPFCRLHARSAKLDSQIAEQRRTVEEMHRRRG
jgi:hypothetical protein